MTGHSGEPLSPTERTRLGRLSEKARTDRQELHDLLDTALVAHVGVDAGGYPLVLPTAFAVDRDGPDRDGTLYLHGSVAAKWLVAARHSKVCVTVTEVDGIVAARSGFESSMNYRTAVILGEARVVDDPDERTHALDLMVDHMVPGRAATIRRPTRKELAATQVLAVALWEASLKVRTGGPDDEDDDVADNPWGGHIPLYRVAGAARRRRGFARAGPGRRTPSRGRPGRPLGSLTWNAPWSWSSPTASAVVSPVRSSGASRRRATGWCGWSCARRPRSCWRSTTPSTRASRSTGLSSSSCCPGPWPRMVVEGERVIEGFRVAGRGHGSHRRRAGHHPWRPGAGLGPGGAAEHRPRLRLARVRGPRDRDLVPRPLSAPGVASLPL